jgi:hypothetical protein
VGRPTAFAADAPLPDDDLTPGSRKRKSRSRIEHLYVDLPSIADLPCGRALANLKLDIQLAGALNAEAAKDTSLVLPLPFLFFAPNRRAPSLSDAGATGRSASCSSSRSRLQSDADALGGFKRSSQHSEVGGCDERCKAPIGAVRTSPFAIARTAVCCRTQ